MPEILIKQDGPILRVTLNQPERGNAVSDGMVADLTRIIEGAEKTASVVVLRGAGADFCVGRAMMGAAPKNEPDAYERRAFSDVVFNCYGAMRDAKVPIIAVVQGRALGFGCAIAAACDITLASDAAVFQVPEMAHNILPTMVMSSFIDRLPRKAISYLVYSTAEITPERALSFGIVSEVVPAAKLNAAVETLCAAILKAPLPAIYGVKEYVKSAPDMAVYGAIEFARNLHATVNSSGEMRRKHLGVYTSAYDSMLAGQVDLESQSAIVASPLVKDGKLKAFAIIGRKRLACLADPPTMGELGDKKLDIDFWHMLPAPAGTPQPIVDKLNAALRAALADAKVQKTFADGGMDEFPPDEETPEAAAALLKREIALWGDVIRANHIAAQ